MFHQKPKTKDMETKYWSKGHLGNCSFKDSF